MISVTNNIRRLCDRFTWVTMIALLTAMSVHGQGFERSFGGPNEDQGQALITTRDYGFLEVGWSESLGDDNDVDFYVVRTDKDGIEIWSQVYDKGFKEIAKDVIELDDASLLIVGFREDTPGSPVIGHLLKIDSRGNEIWDRDYSAGDQNLKLEQIIRSEEGGFLLTGSIQLEETGRDAALLLKIDEDGQEVWRQTYTNGYLDTGVGAVALEDGYILGLNKSDADANLDIVLIRTNLAGDTLFSKVWGTVERDERIYDIILLQDGNSIAFAGSTDNTGLSLIAKADLNGDTLWLTEIDASDFGEELTSIIEENDGTTLTAAGNAVSANALDSDVLLTKVNSLTGNQVWQRILGDDDVFNRAEDVVATLEGGYAIAAYSTLFGALFNDLTLYKTNGLGVFLTNHVRGRVYQSLDGCNPFEPGDLGLKEWLVKAESQDGNATFFGSTDGLGNFDLQVDTGTYVVSLLQKNNRWDICNPVGFIDDLSELYDSTYHEFPLTAALDCPLLEVDLSAGPAIGCMEQQITLHYGNQGSVTATDVTTEVMLDPAMTFIGSTHPLVNQDGQTLSFNLPDLAPNDQGEFIITVMISCGGLVDQQALSTEAIILPDFNESCAPPSEEWDGVIINVDGNCDGDSIRFTIRNDGIEDMVGPLNYIVVEDQILVRPSTGFTLGMGETQDVALENEGGTYRVIAEQSTDYNGSFFPTAVVEGCESEMITEFSVGQVAQFSDNDGNLNIDILTQEVLVLTSGPNLAMRAYPKGYQDSIITPTTDLEYTVFFGLDNAEEIERVVIRDTLSPMLDFNTLEVGASSHPYDFVLQQNGVLRITFDSIQFLADGGTGGVDPELRQGYVTYRLSQKPNNSVGTEINNRAAVYFDYRTPMRTNSVRHVVGCENLFDNNCFLTNSSNFPQLTGVKVDIFPNPMKDRTTVRILDWENPSTRFSWQLYDNSGRLLRTVTSQSDQFELTRQNLPTGSYPYELWGDGQLISNGTLIVQ
ncbi:MAG: T9SS type A sorting domain-containing protein [Bacteroidota bacterium]